MKTKRALIYIDPDAVDAALELTGVVDEMYGRDNCTVYGLCIEDAPTDPATDRPFDGALDGAIDVALRVTSDTVDPYDAASVAACIAELHETHRFDAVLFPATTFGRTIAPRTAMRLHVGLVADVTEIRRNGEEIHLVRPAFSGRMLAAVRCRGDGPVTLTVRQNTFTRDLSDRRETRSIPVQLGTPGASRLRLVRRTRKSESYDIREADVLVSGGGGVMRYFNELESLAALLHGAVSASRRVVDHGTAPRHIQVGQSGKMVRPKLYIALGISGSIQHVVGVKNAEYIISVNTDPRAPMCSLSDIFVEGDARAFIAGLTKRINTGGAVRSSPGVQS